MKVGILTFHRAPNYGTALQAFATQKGISKLDADSQIINYRPQYIERTLKVRKINNAKSLREIASICVNAAIYPKMQQKKAEKFLSFFKFMNLSKTVCTTTSDVEKVANEYDVVVSGSDQLFNKNITSDDMTFFVPFEHKHKVTFASSFGELNLSDERVNQIAPYLSSFDAISVREKSAQDIILKIKENTPEIKSVTPVLDPTFLLTKDEWNSYADENLKLPKDGYILTYYTKETSLMSAITNELHRKTGLKVVNLKPSKKQMIFRQGINLSSAGPAQFLSCYKNASYVVTNSFHGIAFAINYSVPFFASSLPMSMAGDVNARLIDICNLFDLSHRWIDSDEKLKCTDLMKPFEKETENILSNLRQHSFDYLKDALKL